MLRRSVEQRGAGEIAIYLRGGLPELTDQPL